MAYRDAVLTTMVLRSSSLVVVVVWPPGGTHTGHQTTNMDGCLYGLGVHYQFLPSYTAVGIRKEQGEGISNT